MPGPAATLWKLSSVPRGGACWLREVGGQSDRRWSRSDKGTWLPAATLAYSPGRGAAPLGGSVCPLRVACGHLGLATSPLPSLPCGCPGCGASAGYSRQSCGQGPPAAQACGGSAPTGCSPAAGRLASLGLDASAWRGEWDRAPQPRPPQPEGPRRRLSAAAPRPRPPSRSCSPSPLVQFPGRAARAERRRLPSAPRGPDGRHPGRPHGAPGRGHPI